MKEEDQLQCDVIEHLHVHGAPGIFYFHAPNGGSRHVIEAKKLKRMGVRAGVPDLVLLRRQQLTFLELKSPAGRLSDVQKQVHDELEKLGFVVMVAYGLEMALGKLREAGFLRG